LAALTITGERGGDARLAGVPSQLLILSLFSIFVFALSARSTTELLSWLRPF
jgi:hypothetical protein